MPKPCEGDRRAVSRAHLSLQAREQRRGPPRQCPQRAAARERCDSSSHRSRQSPASKVSSIVHGGLAEGRRQDHRRTPSRVHECVQLKRVGYQRRFSQHAGVRSERLDGPDVGKPKPKPDPKGQDRPEMHQATVYPPRLGEKNKGEFVWPKDLFTLGPSARYLFAIPGSCETCHAVNVVPSGGSEQSVQLFCRLVWSLWYGLCERSMVAPLQVQSFLLIGSLAFLVYLGSFRSLIGLLIDWSSSIQTKQHPWLKTTDPRQPESHECGLVCAEGGGRDRRTSHFLLSYYSLNLFVLP